MSETKPYIMTLTNTETGTVETFELAQEQYENAWGAAHTPTDDELESGLLEAVREHLASPAMSKEAPDSATPVLVRFGVTEWEDGYYFATSSVEVLWSTGKAEKYDDGWDDFDEILTAHGKQGSLSGLVVNVVTGEIDDEATNWMPLELPATP